LPFQTQSLGRRPPIGIGNDEIARVVVDHRGAEDPDAVHEDAQALARAYLPARADAVLEARLLEFEPLAERVYAVHEEDALAAAVAAVALEARGEHRYGLVHISRRPEDVGRVGEAREDGSLPQLPRLREAHPRFLGLEVELGPGIALRAAHRHGEHDNEEGEHQQG
jgi:hypothetical protein